MRTRAYAAAFVAAGVDDTVDDPPQDVQETAEINKLELHGLSLPQPPKLPQRKGKDVPSEPQDYSGVRASGPYRPMWEDAMARWREGNSST